MSNVGVVPRYASLEPRLSVPDFVLQLWRNSLTLTLRFFSKAARQKSGTESLGSRVTLRQETDDGTIDAT